MESYSENKRRGEGPTKDDVISKGGMHPRQLRKVGDPFTSC
jgi:hypothetical protein